MKTVASLVSLTGLWTIVIAGAMTQIAHSPVHLSPVIGFVTVVAFGIRFALEY